MFRLARTVVLGAVAAALGIWWLGRAYDVEESRLLGFLATSALLVVGCIALAGVAGAAFGWLRHRRSGRKRRGLVSARRRERNAKANVHRSPRWRSARSPR